MALTNQYKMVEINRKVKAWLESHEHRRRWPRGLKEEIVLLTRQGFSITDVSRATGIYIPTISKWCRDSKTKNMFAELAVVPEQRIPVNSGSEVFLHTSRGHLVRLSKSDLSDLFQAGVL